MIELNGMLEPMLKELRQVLSSVQGAKSIDEALTISYVVEVEDESVKEKVETVSSLLATQAEKYGFTIEVTPATKKEIQKSKDLMSEFVSKSTVFKS